MAECTAGFHHRDVFYDLRHRIIYRAMVHLKSFDLVTLEQTLRDNGGLEKCGGTDYLLSLPDKVPTAANLGFYIGIVLEKYRLRKIVKTCAEVTNRIFDHPGGDLSDLNFSVQSDLADCFEGDTKPVDQVWDYQYLMGYNVAQDPNCVIGVAPDGRFTRYLCRANLAWIIAQSGIGKSVLAVQIGMSFAIGVPMFGIKPFRALKVLYIQAENDEGDTAESIQGVGKHLNLSGDSAVLMQNNFKVIRPMGRIGKPFCDWLEKIILESKADLVIADPLLSFAGIDVSRQDRVSEFLRVWLGPVLHRTGCVLIGIHHTGKPKSEQRNAVPKTLLDYAYDGIGSSELVNFARAVIIVNQPEPGVFRMMLSKRGARANAHHTDGTPTQVIWMRHSPDPKQLSWIQADPPEDPPEIKSDSGKKGGRPSAVEEINSMNLHGFCAGCVPSGESQSEAAKRLEKWLAKQHKDISIGTATRAIRRLVESQKLVKGEEGLYFKGPNA